MKLLDTIIDSVTETKEPISDILRRCLVLAHKLKNDTLKEWVTNELNGYVGDAELPDYRIGYGTALGIFLGPGGRSIENQPLASAVLKEDLRHFATDVRLHEAIAAYESAQGNLTYHAPWPADLVAMYQRSFIQGFALASAWMPIPGTMMLGMIDTIRTRILTLCLEIQSALPDDVEKPTEALPAEKIERMVQINIYGGNNNVGDHGVIHANINNVIAGDLNSLKVALSVLGLNGSDAEELQIAIEADKKEDDPKPGLGKRALEWVGKAAVATAKAGLKISGDVATATFTAIAMKYGGIPPA